MEPLCEVLRVVNVLPQVQVTSVVLYSGWMSFFMVSSRGYSRRVALEEVREPEPASKCATEALAGANRSTLHSTARSHSVFPRADRLRPASKCCAFRDG
jgi:hypothetical protein